MFQNKTKVRLIFWGILIISGLGLGVAFAAFNIPKQTAFWISGIYMAVLVIASVTIDVLWTRGISQKMEDAAQLIYRDNDPAAFLRETEQLLSGQKSSLLRQCYYINMSVGYYYQGDYQTALDWLHKLNVQKLTAQTEPIYWADLAMTYFHLGNVESAMRIAKEKQSELRKWKNVKSLRPTLDFLEIYIHCFSGNKAQAKTHLEQLRQQWTNPCFQRKFQHLDRLLKDAPTAL